MAAITLELPSDLLKALKKMAERDGKSLEEVVSEAVLKQCGVEDPEVKSEIHLKLCEKYLREGEELLEEGDYVQASEKAWGAASQAVKAVAAKRGSELRSHEEIHKEIIKLARETGDDEIRSLWQSAISLHQNFYENWLPPEMVKWNIDDVKKLVEKLKDLM